MSLFNTDLGYERQWVQVGDCYAITKKPRDLDLSSFETIPFAPMDVMPQGGGYAPEFVPKSPKAISSGTYFAKGDVLVAKITPSFENGKQALVFDLPTPFGYATTEIIPLHPHNTAFDRRFLFFYLLHPDIRNYIADRMEGSTGRQRIPNDVLLNLPFPVFSPRDQKQICDLLELIQKARLTEIKLSLVATNLKRATMQKLFTCGLRDELQKQTEIDPIPESWEVAPLGDYFEIVQGLSLRGNLATNGTGIPFLRTSNVYWGRIDLSNISRMDVETTAMRDLQYDDLLVCEGGEIGRAAVWSNEIENCTYQNHVYRLRPTVKGKINPKFAMRWLEEGFCHRRVYEGTGNKTTIPNLSRSRLSELKMPITTLDEQNEMVAILDAVDRKINLHQKKRAVLDDLFKTILHQLMTGKIHTSDLNIQL